MEFMLTTALSFVAFYGLFTYVSIPVYLTFLVNCVRAELTGKDALKPVSAGRTTKVGKGFLILSLFSLAVSGKFDTTSSVVLSAVGLFSLYFVLSRKAGGANEKRKRSFEKLNDAITVYGERVVLGFVSAFTLATVILITIPYRICGKIAYDHLETLGFSGNTASIILGGVANLFFFLNLANDVRRSLSVPTDPGTSLDGVSVEARKRRSNEQ